MRGHVSQPSETMKSTGKICFRLLNSLSGANDNVCISPLSIGIALQLVLCGADGNTLEELLQALDIKCAGRDALATDFHNSMQRLLAESRGVGFEGPGARVQFSVANSLWSHESAVLHPGFVDYLQRYYAAEARSMDFANPQTLSTINAWVSAKTYGKIPVILQQLDPSQVLVLINCAYFKARWAAQFDMAQTIMDNFFLFGDSPVQVPMMQMSCTLPYYRDQSCEVVELAYTDKRFCMYVILPTRGTSLKHFVASFSFEQYQRSIVSLADHRGQFAMPRFKFEYGKRIKPQLMQLGISEAFTDKANFWNMLSPSQPKVPFFKIDQVVHKTFIDVNEEGTEAAAATAITMWGGSMPPPLPPFEMKVDRPFMFVIAEKDSDAILFAGSVQDPRSPGGDAA